MRLNQPIRSKAALAYRRSLASAGAAVALLAAVFVACPSSLSPAFADDSSAPVSVDAGMGGSAQPGMPSGNAGAIGDSRASAGENTHLETAVARANADRSPDGFPPAQNSSAPQENSNRTVSSDAKAIGNIDPRKNSIGRGPSIAGRSKKGQSGQALLASTNRQKNPQKTPAKSLQAEEPQSVASSDSLLADTADRLNALAFDAENKLAQAGTNQPGATPSGGFKLKPLPPEPDLSHSENSNLRMGPLQKAELVKIRLLQPIELDAEYSQPMTLKEALACAIDNSLAIKISRESWNYQRWQYLGSLISAVPIPNFSTSLNLTHTDIISNNQTSNATVYQETVRFPVFQGGGAVYSAISQYYREKGWQHAYYTSINDALLDVYQKYDNLALQHVLLHIRAKAVQVSEAQLHLNNNLYQAGSATKLAIMQSRTQLAQDREALIEQQVAVRQAALALSFALNMPMSVNIIPQMDSIQESPLVPQNLNINRLLTIAVNSRPDLRQYEMYRLAAARNIQVAASALYPQASFFTSYTHTKTIVRNDNPTPPSFSNSSSSNNSGGGNSSGGSGNSSGGSGNGSGGNGNFQNTAGAGVFGGLFNTVQAGFTLSWSLSNMGLTAAVNTKSAQILARQALWQANQALLLADEQVRADYDGMLAARSRIDNSAYGVVSAREALRLANLRLASGMGTNIDSIQAQRDYINALVTQAQAIINSNMTQAQLLHDMGVISYATLMQGYRTTDTPSPQPGGI